MAAWIAAMMLLPVPQELDAKKPWNVGDRGHSVCAGYQVSSPGIPVKATHHLFTRRVGSPGYGEGSSQGQKGVALAVYGDVAVPSLQRISL
jgi:hypothetical protein